jgi:HD-GYP domain-containing protein (c-di-GMP phosphodiesterase class II)
VSDRAPASTEQVRAAELIAALSLATDLATGLPLEHGLESTLVAMSLCERLGVDPATASQTFYVCQLFYVGCTADAETAAELFEGDIHEHIVPVIFGSRAEQLAALTRAVASPDGPAARRALRLARNLPRAMRAHPRHLAAACEVARMLAERLGLPRGVQSLFAHLSERWDGAGQPGTARGDQIPVAVRIAHVARDAAVQGLLGGPERAARVARERAGAALDPAIASLLADEAQEILAPGDGPAWDRLLAREPAPHLVLEGEAIDRALAAMGDFADLACPYLVGHSAGVAELAGAAAALRGAGADPTAVRRAALVHDIGRIAVPVAIWQKPGPLTADEWERIRLHAYHSERILSRSPFLSDLARTASAHHERLDGSGYHRGSGAAELEPAARLLAGADAYAAMGEPRPHREPLAEAAAADALGREAGEGRLDADAVAAVLEAAGQPVPRIPRPAGLTDREAQVVGLLARGLQTKQVARTLGISAKTADRHVQNAYAKIGVSTRAAAALFAMEHGLAAWGELPMGGGAGRP